MRDDRPVPYTLAIADWQTDLQVLSFTGKDSLNEVYRFEVDLISRDPNLDFASWLGRDAFLGLGPVDCGVHGRIFHAAQLYAGACLSLYHVSLMPCLQALGQRPQRRIFHDLSAPQLIERLLQAHGLTSGYRFDKLVGVYPPRPLRLQYDETDLHLLRRVCEEEGIHFRFERHRERHQLVFADDPASFPENPLPLRFCAEAGLKTRPVGATHLAERRSGTLHEHHSLPQEPGWIATTEATDTVRCTASNQPLGTPAYRQPSDPDEAAARQRDIRRLERMRCARRQFTGHSNQPALASGQVVQLIDHPQALCNDQWLLTGIEHAGTQLAVLEGMDPHDIAAVLLASQVDGALPITPEQDYHNRFDVLPWAMPFRPALKCSRPAVAGLENATLIGTTLDEQGRLPIRFDWQPAPLPGKPRAWPMAYVLDRGEKTLARMYIGMRVQLSHLDRDPELPVICGLLDDETKVAAQTRLHLDGMPLDSTPQCLEVQAGRHLHIEAVQGLLLHGRRGCLEITPQGISLHGPRAVLAGVIAENPHQPRGPDLRLTDRPDAPDRSLARCNWYIVRMSQPGLEYLARLAPEHFLLEGTTDDEGSLRLSSDQIRRLVQEYQRTPNALCLIYPGQCLKVRAWLEQQLGEYGCQAFILNNL